jgi:transcriptional regulator with XRE-family HTH domain
MGYRGKIEQQEQARVLRAQNLTPADIATRLGVSKSSVSLWVRDVPFTPSKRRHGPHRRPHPQRVAKLAEIEALDAEGRTGFQTLSDDAFFAEVALYAGEAQRGMGSDLRTPIRYDPSPRRLRNSSPWTNRARMRVSPCQDPISTQLGVGSEVAGIPRSQFRARTEPPQTRPFGE